MGKAPGCGKTQTLIEYAKKWSKRKFLYVAFNNTIVKQVKEFFSNNVTCTTYHSLVVRLLRETLLKVVQFGRLTPDEVIRVLEPGDEENLGQRAKNVVDTRNTFFVSTDESITLMHIPKRYQNTGNDLEKNVSVYAARKT
uniref:DNA helicase n=1 Tax=Sphenodon punctatus TaxID=8508 RepID=A0A8D0G8A8_SPHPU